MRHGFRIGKLFGINLNIDWSWVFIFLLITWNLAIVFGQFRPNWSPGLRWGMALAASILFFVSVLAHEFAHSLVAKAQGMNVRNITLFLFGGVSNIQRHPPSPGAEFLITIVGPMTSLILGAAFLIASGASVGPFQITNADPAAVIGQLGPVALLLMWLGSINILVGLFNLIPGFPLDGGRLLRSALWAATDNLTQATRWAAWVGQAVAWLLIASGIAMVFGVRLPFFGTGLIGGLWLAFIGWFLNSASVHSYQQVVVQDILEDVPVRRMMRSNPPTVQANQTVSELVHEHVMNTDDHAFPVLDQDRFVGLVTLADIRGVSRDAWETTTVHEIMTSREQLVTATAEEDAADALNKLMQRDVSQVPVLSNGHLAGLLRRRDIVKWLQLQSETI